MDEQGVDALDGDDLMRRLATNERDETALYSIFTLLNRGGYADVRFGGAMTVAFVQPTEKGLQVTHGWPVPGQSDVAALLQLLDQRIRFARHV